MSHVMHSAGVVIFTYCLSCYNIIQMSVCVCVCVCVCVFVVFVLHTKLASVYNAQYNTVYTATQHMWVPWWTCVCSVWMLTLGIYTHNITFFIEWCQSVNYRGLVKLSYTLIPLCRDLCIVWANIHINGGE